MIFKEEDVLFERLSPTEFEELCFDLLLRVGFQNLVWRRGGADQGRDIEGKYIVNNQLVGSIEEKWFFECKHYTNGVPVEQLITKIAWADAEKPNHLVIFTTSYLSNSSRQWIEKIQKDKQYKIHIIENKLIKYLLINTFPELIEKYFVDKYEKLLLETMKNWLIHDILPNPPILSLFSRQIDFEKLCINEVTFLWNSYKFLTDEINDWKLEEKYEPFSLEFLDSYLINYSNCNSSIIKDDADIKLINYTYSGSDQDSKYKECFRAKILYNNTLSLYSFIRNKEDKGIEVLINANSSFTSKIRYVGCNARNELEIVFKLIHEEFDFA